MTADNKLERGEQTNPNFVADVSQQETGISKIINTVSAKNIPPVNLVGASLLPLVAITLLTTSCGPVSPKEEIQKSGKEGYPTEVAGIRDPGMPEAGQWMQADNFSNLTKTGRVYRDSEGKLYMFVNGRWEQQEPDKGILVETDEEGNSEYYLRLDEIPGAASETFSFGHWTGEAVWDEELETWVRTACYLTADGLGCNVRYRVVGD